MKLEIVDNEYAEATLFNDVKMIHLRWKRFTQGEPYREIVSQCLQKFKLFNVDKWLIDSRDMGLISVPDQQWSAQESAKYTQYMKNLKTAFVISESVFTKMSINKVANNLPERENAKAPKFFVAVEPAKEWLMS